MIFKIRNKVTGVKYGRWDLKRLINALEKPLEFEDPKVAMCLKYDLCGDDLNFEIEQVKKTDFINDVSGSFTAHDMENFAAKCMILGNDGKNTKQLLKEFCENDR